MLSHSEGQKSQISVFTDSCSLLRVPPASSSLSGLQALPRACLCGPVASPVCVTAYPVPSLRKTSAVSLEAHPPSRTTSPRGP